MLDRRTFIVRTLQATAGAALLGACQEGAEEQATPGPGRTTGTTPDRTEVGARPTLRLPARDVGFPSPFSYRRGPGYVKATLIYDTLVWKDASGELLPWLAEDWEGSEDGLTHTFRLREGVTWHDGEPLTADDVAFTFGYFGQQDLSPEVITQPFPEIDEVRATDERTVEFHLAAPLAAFYGFGGVGSILIVPEHVWAEVDEAAQAADPELLVGTGPYRLEEYSRGEGAYLFTAYDDFFLGRPFVERLEYRPVNDPLAGLEADEVDVAFPSGVPPSVLDSFRDRPEFEVIQQPPGNFGSGLFWNLAEGGALADERFRHACAMAIDRQDLVERAYGGLADPGNPGWIPAAHPFHAEVEQYEYDPDAANALLDEAGYAMGDDQVRTDPDGQPLRFELLTASPPPSEVDLVVGALADLGVRLEPESLDTPAFNERVIAGASQLSIITFGGMNTDHGSGGYLRQIYHSETRATQHAQGYANPEVDRLIEQQERTLDEGQRRETVAEIQRLIAQDLPILPLVYPHGFTVFDPDTFDAWYYTEGGIGGTVPLAENKHLFVTGRRTGLEVETGADGG